MQYYVNTSPDNGSLCVSVCHGCDALPICGPIRACTVSATVTLPHCEPVMLPHYSTVGQNLLFIVQMDCSTDRLWVLPTSEFIPHFCSVNYIHRPGYRLDKTEAKKGLDRGGVTLTSSYYLLCALF